MLRCLFLLLISIPLLVAGQESVGQLEQRMNDAQGEEQLRLMITLGNIYAASDPDKGLELGLKAAFLAKRMGSQLFEGQALLLMGLSSLNAKQQENGIRYYNRALNHFEKNNLQPEQIIALKGIAQIYYLAKNHDLAIRYLERALQISNNFGNVSTQIDIHQTIGDIALSQKNFSVAYRSFTKVHALLGDEEQLSSKELFLKADSYRQIGFVFRNLGQFNESLSSYRKAASIGVKLQNKPMEMKDVAEIAFSHFLMQQLDSALSYYNQVMAFYQLQNDSLSMVEVVQSIGDVFFEMNQYRQSVASYNRALDLAIKLNLVQDQVSALVNISRCFNAFGDYPSSKEYLNRALAIATRENLSNSAADVYRYLSMVNEEDGKYMQALEFYKLWSELRDSIYTEESGQKMARMQILYEITQKERENEILRQNSEIQELQLTKTGYQRMVFIALALFFFSLLVLFALFYRVKQQEFIKQKETEQRIIELNKNLEKRMIQEIKKQEKQQLLLAQKSKLESLGTLAAGIAHEINQPLGGISMGLDNMLIKLSEKNFSESYFKEKFNLMFENVERIKKIIDNTRTFSRAHKPVSFEKVDVNEVVNRTLLMVETQYRKLGVNLKIDLVSDIEPVVGDKIKLEQVLLNLLSNAKHAVDDKAKVSDSAFQSTIEITTKQDEINVYLSVWDNGVGIKNKDLERIFDPFYTTKKEDLGTGLGLSISYGFIKDLMGEIFVESKEGEYTIFKVVIPKT